MLLVVLLLTKVAATAESSPCRPAESKCSIVGVEHSIQTAESVLILEQVQDVVSIQFHHGVIQLSATNASFGRGKAT